MRTHRTSLLCLILLTLISACGEGPAPSGPDVQDPETPDPTGPIAATITPEGTTLSVTTDEGVVVDVTFPPGSVWAPTDIALTPAAPDAGGWMAVRLEPAGLRLRQPVDVTATFPGGIDLSRPVLTLDGPVGTALVGVTVDEETRSISGTLPSFLGYPADPTSAAQALPSARAGGAAQPGSLSAGTMTCAERVSLTDASFTEFVSDNQFEQALRAAMNIAALLQDQGCQTEAGAWIVQATATACQHANQVIQEVRSEPISTYQDFGEQIGRMMHWLGVMQYLDDECTAWTHLDAALDEKTDAFLDFFNARVSSVQDEDWSTFQDLKDESVNALQTYRDAQTLGLNDAAQRILVEAFRPTVDRMRTTAYTLCRNDGWHYALSRVTATGYFAARDIVGQTPPRPGSIWPAPTDWADFGDADVFDDLQQCATRLAVSSVVTSGGVLAEGSGGGGDAPGQATDTLTLETPTRGTLRLEGEMGGFTCFDGTAADQRVEVLLEGVPVHTIERSGDGYLGAEPIEFDIEEMAATAGVTPREGEANDLVLRRHRTSCDARLWGPETHDLLTVTLQWRNPTLEVEVVVPQSAAAGDEVPVDVRVTVVDQLGEPTHEPGIDVALTASGGDVASTSGGTDTDGYFRTTLSVGNDAGGLAEVTAVATAPEGVTAQGSGSVGILGGYVRVIQGGARVDAQAHASGPETSTDRQTDTAIPTWSYAGEASASAEQPTGNTSAANASVGFTITPGEGVDGASAMDGQADASTTATVTDGGAGGQGDGTFQLEFEVVGGVVAYTMTGSLMTVQGDQEGVAVSQVRLVRREGIRTVEVLEEHSAETTSALEGAGVLQPGTYYLTAGAHTGISISSLHCPSCSESMNAATQVTLTFGSAP